MWALHWMNCTNKLLPNVYIEIVYIFMPFKIYVCITIDIENEEFQWKWGQVTVIFPFSQTFDI